MPVVDWDNSTAPVVTLRRRTNQSREISWDGPLIWAASAGDTVRIHIRFRADLGNSRMRVWVERLNLQNNVVETIDFIEKWPDEPTDQTVPVEILVTGQLTRFRVRAQNFSTFMYREDAPPDYDNERWDPPQSRDYAAFVQMHGDFSLDYVPMTILYCPPNQDMTNAVTQSTTYGTVVTLGSSELVGSRAQTTSQVRGGVRVTTPYFGVSWNASESEQTSDSQSVENASRNSVAFGYTWSTTLIADNQRAIGRSYWGPLGDLFVLLKNPWFTIIGDETGASLAVNEHRTSLAAELVIVPAHRLLRPGGDPVASRIPVTTRRRILELDPFIKNLDDFFPEDSGAPLTRAANPHANPSLGSDTIGSNRAALLARYCISNGVELDLSATTNIEVHDQQTNESVYHAEVTNGLGLSQEIEILDFFQNGLNAEFTDTRFVRVAYQASHETRLTHVTTAKCSLIRNQNEVDLRDIDIWWDKHFSTFMFRVIEPWTGVLVGVVADVIGIALANVQLDLVATKLGGKAPDPEGPLGDPQIYSAMSDRRGRFEIKNIVRAGTYELRHGRARMNVVVSEEAVQSGEPIFVRFERVKRKIDLKRSALWELMEALHISKAAALRIQSALRAAPADVDRALTRALEAEKLSLKEIKRRIGFTLG